MPDDKSAGNGSTQAPLPSTSKVRIPPDTARTFAELIDLIMHSESMNDEERQYWVDILPAMTADQVTQLRDILQNERRQLAAIDEKYEKDVAHVGERRTLEKISEQRHEKHEQLQSQEAKHRSEEQERAEDILKEME